jgi:hypothetical protein
MPIEQWRRRLYWIVILVGYPVAIAAVAVNVWLTASLYKQTSVREHIAAKIVSLDGYAHTSRLGFRTYSVTVRYRIPTEKRDTYQSLDESSYTLPSPGDPVTVLKGPHGSVEADPFPEMWYLTAISTAFFAGMIWLLTQVHRKILAPPRK